MEVMNLNYQNAFNAKHQNGLLLERDYVVSTAQEANNNNMTHYRHVIKSSISS